MAMISVGRFLLFLVLLVCSNLLSGGEDNAVVIGRLLTLNPHIYAVRRIMELIRFNSRVLPKHPLFGSVNILAMSYLPKENGDIELFSFSCFKHSFKSSLNP
jgi:hypothetical protein